MRRRIEVDLSLANVALDLVGQATHFLGLAAEAEGKGGDADALAFRRDVLDFTNCLLVEQPNGDFAQTIARQFLFSNYQKLLFEALMKSSEPRIAEIAAKAVKEVTYHVAPCQRLGRAPGRRHGRKQGAHYHGARLDVALRGRIVRHGRHRQRSARGGR